MTTSTTLNKRNRQAGIGTAMLGLALVLTACGSEGDGFYQSSEYADEMIQIDGDDVIAVSGTSDQYRGPVLDDFDKGNFNPEADYVDETGSLNDDRTMIIWDNGENTEVEISSDMISFDDGYEVYIDADSDQAQAARDELDS